VANSTLNEFTIYPSWDEACRISTGYQDPELVLRLAERLASEPPWRTRIADDKYVDPRSLELLFVLQLAVGSSRSQVRVADVGGGNGYMAVIAQRSLGYLKWDWTVFESAAIA